MEKDCVFCDRTKFEERLIGETKDSWIIATLGQISNGGYVLLVPKHHIPCIGAMAQSEITVLVSLIEKINLVLQETYGATLFFPTFEHGIVGQTVKHAHIHFVPEYCYLTDRIRKDFSDKEIRRLNSWHELAGLYSSKQEPYLLWRDSTAGIKVCWNPPAPPQFLRTVVAEALGRPERANWKNMDPELDKRLWSETVRRLKSYFS